MRLGGCRVLVVDSCGLEESTGELQWSGVFCPGFEVSHVSQEGSRM